MLQLNDIYSIYCKYYNDKLLKSREDVGELLITRENIVADLVKYQDIFLESNTTLAKVLPMTDARNIASISFTGKVPQSLEDIIRLLLKDNAFVNKAIIKAEKAVETYANLIVDKETFSLIIKTYNKTKVNLLITKGYTWNLGSGLGFLSIVIKKIPTLKTKEGKAKIRPNWAATRKRKAELEAQGIPLYSEENPDGVKYLVAHTDETQAYFQWSGANPYTVANVADIKFKPTKGANGICLKLSTYRRANPTVDNYYTDKINDNYNGKQ